jgi:hypothetical protein
MEISPPLNIPCVHVNILQYPVKYIWKPMIVFNKHLAKASFPFLHFKGWIPELASVIVYNMVANAAATSFTLYQVPTYLPILCHILEAIGSTKK